MGIERRDGGWLQWGLVATRLLNWTSALLLAGGLAASQVLLGGWWSPALAAPGYLLVGAAAVLAGLLFWRITDSPSAWCVGLTLLFAGYLLVRQGQAPDPYAARDNLWLLLGAVAVYLTAAWQLRGDGVRWLVLGTLGLLVVVQAVLAVAQFTAPAPFHVLADLAPQLNLPRGDQPRPNHGWVSGTLASRGSLSAVVQASTFLALGLLVWGRERIAVKLVLLWVTAAGFVALTLCLSRAAYLGAAAGLVTFALVSFFVLGRGALAHRFWLGFGALALLGLTLLLAFFIAWESPTVRWRFDEMGSDAYRESLWFIVVPPMLALDPWFGAGANMFDQLSLRYRGTSLAGWPVHAHNDWLQLLVEYGRVGFVLGGLFFIIHLASGWRTALRLARENPPVGLLPRSTELGLVTGALAVLVAQGVHSLVDYRLHVQAVALPVALAAGWIAAARVGLASSSAAQPVWLKALALTPALAGAALLWVVARDYPAERQAFAAINAMQRGETREAWDLTMEGLRRTPSHPRLLVLAGESAAALGNAASDERERFAWYRRSADYFAEAVRERPYLPYAWREYALAADWSGRAAQARSLHLRAIAREPDHARGYEYLGLHYWRQGRYEEATRLMRLAQRFPGSRLAGEILARIEESRRDRPSLPEETPSGEQ